MSSELSTGKSNDVRTRSNSSVSIRRRSRRSSSVGKLELGDSGYNLLGVSKPKDPKNLRKETSEAENSIMKSLRNFLELSSEHMWIIPLIIITIVYSIFFKCEDQSENNPLHMFVSISYRIDNTDMYGKGIKDLCFLFYYMIVFTFVREFFMDMIIRPIVLKAQVRSKHKLNRLMEQLFYIIYYGLSSPFGLWIMYNSDLWLFRTDTMYKTYPDFNNPFYFKWFYLGQASFWAQQACVLVLQLEKPRKDYKELVFHHIVTLLLIWSSYVFHFTKMGLAIYITMDVSDWWLAMSKTLNYFESILTGPVFVIFMFIWIYLRHVVNIRILWSVLTEFRTEGTYILNFATQQYKCWISQTIVFILIFALQLVNLYWLYLILRILVRMLITGEKGDERSENSSEEVD
ncbi:sphingosine N-acyltransferase lag1 [Maudiozyma exigua]|uniref:Sphingosine N-acyltransferase lag1 n=1 Tax=Maudiozyma exigua TaxID=34358 RepID=A0A9P7BDC2_MAUEX|nr:sphingosine N-acyltransferase lag1 [Kazachstania exigua]